MPEMLAEPDILAAFILLETYHENMDELYTHASGLQALFEVYSDANIPPFLASLRGWVLGRANYTRTVFGELPSKRLPLSESIEFWTQIRDALRPVKNCNSGFVEGLSDWFGELTWQIGKWFEEMAFNELYDTTKGIWTSPAWLAFIVAWDEPITI